MTTTLPQKIGGVGMLPLDRPVERTPSFHIEGINFRFTFQE
jgi:hypothetical protein